MYQPDLKMNINFSSSEKCVSWRFSFLLISFFPVQQQPVFPTSDISLKLNPKTGKVQVIFRGFEGHMYMSEQAEASVSELYLPPVIVAPDVLFV